MYPCIRHHGVWPAAVAWGCIWPLYLCILVSITTVRVHGPRLWPGGGSCILVSLIPCMLVSLYPSPRYVCMARGCDPGVALVSLYPCILVSVIMERGLHLGPGSAGTPLRIDWLWRRIPLREVTLSSVSLSPSLPVSLSLHRDISVIVDWTLKIKFNIYLSNISVCVCVFVCVSVCVCMCVCLSLSVFLPLSLSISLFQCMSHSLSISLSP